MPNPAEPRSSRPGTLILVFVALLAPIGATAQQEPEPQPIVPLQLSFSDPGARSMGFGGAFVALADDATAAFANPAGLVQLIRPEVSVEGRHWDYSTPYTVGGRIEGEASGFGIDDTDGLRTANSGEQKTGLSFLSAAYPTGDWSFAFYRHKFADFEFSAETQGLFFDDPDGLIDRALDQRVSNDLDYVTYGLAAAYRVTDAFDLGLGVVYHDAEIDTFAALYVWDDDSVESFFSPNSYLPGNLVISQDSTMDDNDWTLTGGFLWRVSESWSVGGVYRQGAELENNIRVFAGEAVDFGVPPGTVLGELGVEIQFPETYGLGFAYRAPDGRVTASFQWTHVEYSSIVDSLELPDQTIDDVDELHFGGEYVFLDATPIIAVRLGLWWEPDHQIRATTDDALTRALLPRGDDQMHYAGGLGVVMQNFQVDVGVDIADRVNTLSLSAIYSF
jgi:long-subunit fatty acid transport protein